MTDQGRLPRRIMPPFKSRALRAAMRQAIEERQETIDSMKNHAKQRVAEASEKIFDILNDLPGPRAAAMALAGAHVMLLEAEEIRTQADARCRLDQSREATFDIWKKRNGLAEGTKQ